MPFLRFTRDRRGYENTYVLHTCREKGRPQLRILYWFRTPPGVRVGRGPLDEEAIRWLEARSPGLQFDWARMLKLRPSPGGAPPGSAAPRATSAPRPGPTRPGLPVDTAGELAEERSASGLAPEEGGEEGREAGAGGCSEPAAIETELAVPEVGPEPLEPLARRANAVAALIGEEGLTVLRARYAELKARLAERIADPVRRESLRVLVEELNPDAWVTEEEARQAIDRFEQRYAALRRALGSRRRRRRRRRAGGAGSPAAPSAPRDSGV